MSRADHQYLLSIDQGTTSSRAMLFTHQGELAYTAQRELPQTFPQDGWVEHDAEVIWRDVLSLCQEVLAKAGVTAKAVTAIGITNQRETTVVWDKSTGKPVYNAIVWQDRRTAEYCKQLCDQQGLDNIQAKTGLLLDAYFSASKIRWILDKVEGSTKRAEQGELLFGTIDSFLIWKLTGGQQHLTDATNASRTLLFNIHTQQWDDQLIQLFDIPKAMLPEVKDCADNFGVTVPEHLGEPIPILGVAGDQQAALVGQACFEPGMGKSTYGTGCFIIMNTGSTPLVSRNKLLTTVAYRVNNQVSYGIEGSIFIAGAVIQWLRDGAKLIDNAAQSESYAKQTGIDHPVYFVPAFTGLGAPHWNADARAAILGLNRDTGAEEITTAAIQSVCYQTRDLLEAMKADGVNGLSALRVDGGMVANNWFNQFLADMTAVQIDKPAVTETTALGAAMLAALQAGIYPDLASLAKNWQLEQSFTPKIDPQKREKIYLKWKKALAAVELFAD